VIHSYGDDESLYASSSFGRESAMWPLGGFRRGGGPPGRGGSGEDDTTIVVEGGRQGEAEVAKTTRPSSWRGAARARRKWRRRHDHRSEGCFEGVDMEELKVLF
jgi:hypothetical protein